MLDKLSGVKILLAILVLLIFTVGAHAEYLFDAARTFPLTYAGDMVEAVDITGDGILDLVTVRIRLSVMVGAGDGTFTEVQETTAVLSPVSLAVGDLNGDGMADVALGDDYGSGEGLLRILLGNGDGTFYSNETYVTVSDPGYLDLGDLDNDGDLDVVTTRHYGDQIVAHLNDGNGVFGPELPSQVGAQPMDAVLDNFDDDGILDMAVIHEISDDLHICYGNGDGTFSSNPILSFITDPWGIAAGDLDDSGTQDLVVTTYSDGPEPDLHILLGNGSGDFTLYQQLSITDLIGSPSLVRMDSDQNMDIVLVVGDVLVVMKGNGDGTFDAGTKSHVEMSRYDQFVLEDLDRDEDPDLIAPVNSQEAGMMVVLNRGDGTLQTAPHLDMLRHITWTASSDLDLDGDLDVVMVHEDTTTVKVSALLNAGNGTFSLIDAWEAGSEEFGLHLSVGNLNADSIPDLAVTFHNYFAYESHLAILLGQGDGTFVSSTLLPYDDNLYQSHLCLVDGDGHLDLVTLGRGGAWVHLGNGDGSFEDATQVATGSRITMGAVHDLDGNGTLDLVLHDRDLVGFSVVFGNGSGGFSAPVIYDDQHYWRGGELGDLDQDGDPDLVYTVSTTSLDMLYVRLNDGSGMFLDENLCSERLSVGLFRLADITADGLLDVVAANWEGISVHSGLGNGGFGEVHRFNMFGTTVSLPTSGDFDGDGDLDLVVRRDNPDFPLSGLYFRNTSAMGNLFAAGPGRGEDNPPQVRTFTLAGSSVLLVDQWQAYGVSRYGVNVALGELDGSEGLEVLTGPGPGEMFGPHVRGFENTGVPLPGVSFLAYGTNRWGVNVAAGDIDADGFDEIVTGAGPGEVFGPHVRAWNWDGTGVPEPIPGTSWFAYGTPKYGVKVCCGDIDGDGFDEIITGAGPGAVYGPHVRGWNCDGGGAVAISGVSFLALGTNNWGINVGCGDIDGDGIDEIITGAGPGAVFGPHVRGWNWDGSGSVMAIPGISFFAYEYTEWGANVACGDLDGDGFDEILTGPGPGASHEPRIRGWNYDGSVLTAMEAVDFYGFDPSQVTHGVKPAGLRASRR